jgi:uncharacterized protein (TIGR00299 family) protein
VRLAGGAGVTARVAWFNPCSGASGDMALGALLDAGADLDGVRAMVASVGVTGWSLDAEPAVRGGITATRAVVQAPEDPHHHRTYATVRELLDAAALPERVRLRSGAVFAALAEAEGRLHGVAPDDVHFHEVGALDAIVDVVGTCAALEVLGVDEIRSGPVRLGHGTIGGTAHGTLPNPSPASVAVLASVGAPVVGEDVGVELTTPTGAALLAALAGPDGFGPVPALAAVRATGHGAGGREVAGRANVLQVVLGELAGASTGSPEWPDSLVELAANVDDVTGEVLAHAIAALLAAGALDAWVVPAVMKKGRPAHVVHALARPADASALTAVLARETGTLGVRASDVRRWPAARTESVVLVEGHPVRVKRTAHRIKVEHDDAAAAAESLGWPLRDVLARAEAQATD